MKFGTVMQIAPPPPTGGTPLKFLIFQKQDGGGRHLEKPHKGD